MRKIVRRIAAGIAGGGNRREVQKEDAPDGKGEASNEEV
jgi:hypothetical protein